MMFVISGYVFSYSEEASILPEGSITKEGENSYKVTYGDFTTYYTSKERAELALEKLKNIAEKAAEEAKSNNNDDDRYYSNRNRNYSRRHNHYYSHHNYGHRMMHSGYNHCHGDDYYDYDYDSDYSNDV